MIHLNQPLSWHNISIEEYIELQDAVLDNEEQLEQEDIILREIQILYHEDPYTMSLPKFHQCAYSLKFMNEKMPKMKVKDEYYLNGTKYYLHKKLNDIRVAQFIDYEQIMKANKGIDAYPQFISLFLTPSSNGVYGDGYDVAAVAEDVRKYMSIADANSIAAFFLKLSKAYIVTFLLSIHRSTRKMMNRKERRELRKKTRKMIKLVINGDLYPY